LNWTATQPGITSTILGASKLAQLEDNLSAIEFSIPAELRKRLDEVSAPASIHPYMFFEPFIQGMIHGGASVRAWSAAQACAPQPADSVKDSAKEMGTVRAEKIA
jgi:hypothetical protein